MLGVPSLSDPTSTFEVLASHGGHILKMSVTRWLLQEEQSATKQLSAVMTTAATATLKTKQNSQSNIPWLIEMWLGNCPTWSHPLSKTLGGYQERYQQEP